MRYYRAVTLIEMMVVIAIIGIITSVTIVSFQSGKSDFRLQAAQREVTATIKLAQGYALQGKTQGGVTPCWYGFRFTSVERYEIFYKLPPSCGISNVGSMAEEYNLGNSVTLSFPDVSDLDDTEIYFTIPHANAYDKTGAAYSSSQNITFDFAGAATKTITINKGGNVAEGN